MKKIRSICVFCGSSSGILPEYVEIAKTFGKFLASKNVEIVFGGASVGLMGALAESALLSNGRVIGVIPKEIRPKVGHNGLTKLHVVSTMHQRKQKMFEISDAFICLPGGLGSLEEIFEILTWAQLGFHTKPCGILNISNYFDSLLKFLDHAVSQRFIKNEHLKMLHVSTSFETLLKRFESYKPKKHEKWIGRPLQSVPKEQ